MILLQPLLLPVEKPVKCEADDPYRYRSSASVYNGVYMAVG